MDSPIAEFCQFLRIAFAIQNGSNDGLSCSSTQVADYVGQLDIHLCQCFLHALNTGCHSCCMLRTQPPVSSQHTNIGWGLERVVQESVGVKFQQPLALLHLALPARQVLSMPGIHKKYLASKLLQDVVQGNPTDAG